MSEEKEELEQNTEPQEDNAGQTAEGNAENAGEAAAEQQPLPGIPPRAAAFVLACLSAVLHPDRAALPGACVQHGLMQTG